MKTTFNGPFVSCCWAAASYEKWLKTSECRATRLKKLNAFLIQKDQFGGLVGMFQPCLNGSRGVDRAMTRKKKLEMQNKT